MNLQKQIEKYIPFNKQEEKDKQLILRYMSENKDILTRENEIAHVTASAWVVNKTRTKVLMVYHNIYQSWAWTGGHADGEEDLLHVAMREVEEETGVTHVKPIQQGIFSLEVISVNGHVKREKWVSAHTHFNLTYFLEADEKEKIRKREEENSDVQWIPIQEIELMSKEKWMKENVYSKLKEKMQQLGN